MTMFWSTPRQPGIVSPTQWRGRHARPWVRMFRVLAGALIACASLPTPSVAATVSFPEIYLADPVAGFTKPVDIANAGDGSGRVFVVEQGGLVRIVAGGVPQSEPFLDLTTTVGCAGLFSIAFSPSYAVNGEFYVAHEDDDCSLVVARYGVTAAPGVADPASREVIITIPMATPGAGGHSGAELAFSPIDGYLYVSVGDGSHGGDPGNLAQNPNTLLGKILRLDVDAGGPDAYEIPSSNPFVGLPDHREEIWALGLRNPWRFSFDRVSGDLYIGDVGEDEWEEIDHQPATSGGGENYGWRIMEGGSCFEAAACDPTGLTLPVVEYDHSQGCSVTGGLVARNASQPALDGIYFYGDYCTGSLWGLVFEGQTWQHALVDDTNAAVVTFGDDEAGAVWVADHAAGIIYRLTDEVPDSIDLSVTQSDVPDPVAVNESVTYTVTVTNPSSTEALDVAVVDELPPDDKFQSVTPSQGECTKVGTTVTCRLGILAANSSATIDITVKALAEGMMTNTATVSGNEPDPDPSNNSSAETTNVGEVGADMHVGDLDGVTQPRGRRLEGVATATVHDTAEGVVEGATVSFSYAVGRRTLTASCTTDAAGQCSITTRISNRSGGVTVEVTGVAHDTLTYDGAANHDPDGDSDGTTIFIGIPAANHAG